MSIIHDGDGQMTRYDLGGQVIARAARTDAGWVITDTSGCQSEPIPDTGQARERLAGWDRLDCCRAALRAATDAYGRARQDLEETIRRAADEGVPQTQIARISGFSRQWIRHMLSGQAAP